MRLSIISVSGDLNLRRRSSSRADGFETVVRRTIDGYPRKLRITVRDYTFRRGVGATLNLIQIEEKNMTNEEISMQMLNRI